MKKQVTPFFAGTKAAPPQRGLVQLVYICNKVILYFRFGCDMSSFMILYFNMQITEFYKTKCF